MGAQREEAEPRKSGAQRDTSAQEVSTTKGEKPTGNTSAQEAVDDAEGEGARRVGWQKGVGPEGRAPSGVEVRREGAGWGARRVGAQRLGSHKMTPEKPKHTIWVVHAAIRDHNSTRRPPRGKNEREWCGRGKNSAKFWAVGQREVGHFGESRGGRSCGGDTTHTTQHTHNTTHTEYAPQHATQSHTHNAHTFQNKIGLSRTWPK